MNKLMMKTVSEHGDLFNLRHTKADIETQTASVESQATATQTEEFDYLFKETVSECYFVNNEDRVKYCFTWV